jgi:hypothetical protein
MANQLGGKRPGAAIWCEWKEKIMNLWKGDGMDQIVLEAEGILEDPNREIDPVMAGRARLFFNEIPTLDEFAGKLLTPTREAFAYTFSRELSSETNRGTITERLRMLIVVDDPLLFESLRVIQPLVARAAEAAGVDEVGIVDTRDFAILLVLHRDSISPVALECWTGEEIQGAQRQLHTIHGAA